MRAIRFFLHVCLFVWLANTATAQQGIRRDALAISVLSQSFSAQGGALPADSTAFGKIIIEAGSTKERGTISILNRGTDQKHERIDTPDRSKAITFSRGVAKDAGSEKPMSLERSLTSQEVVLPLPLIVTALTSKEYVVEYIGLEGFQGKPSHHVRIYNSFAFKPKLQALSVISRKDLWIDAATLLPTKIAFERRWSRGPGSFGVPVEMIFSDYRDTAGVRFPFSIKTSLNGAAYAEVYLETVAINTGLSEDQFQVLGRRGQ